MLYRSNLHFEIEMFNLTLRNIIIVIVLYPSFKREYKCDTVSIFTTVLSFSITIMNIKDVEELS